MRKFGNLEVKEKYHVQRDLRL